MLIATIEWVITHSPLKHVKLHGYPSEQGARGVVISRPAPISSRAMKAIYCNTEVQWGLKVCRQLRFVFIYFSSLYQ